MNQALRTHGARTVVVGGGTMGADVAVVLARGGARVTVVDPSAAQRERLAPHVATELQAAGLGHRAALIDSVAALEDLDWQGVVLVVECITERLDAKRALFARLEALAPADAVLASNSSSFPITAIGQGLASQQRMLGLHFFMPAHLVPLVEVVCGTGSDAARAAWLCDFMRACGSVPVLVKKDKPGFLANRLQHALSREAFALIDEGIASAEDVDAAVRFGFGFRYLAAGPVMQRDHAGIDVHCAAAATMYPTLSNTAAPALALSERVARGELGMKTGKGFFDWPEDRRLAERARYDALLRQGLALLAPELPAIDRSDAPAAKAEAA
ncbi:NAD-binding protein [Xylophilus rhododendri]|uniref:NAD-binding protein n=1 Tax=Xylophilus rhododendri TaxID=2697032 RepID=A0A857JBX0_9BURK|nr:3-hydroxyacyl-CoA dehydrogenase NAD-binding domain-containing protein [Xylophilus rhododendri]QHJ00453.1 NAD-binding protein [Xylophilus rhododendri]